MSLTILPGVQDLVLYELYSIWIDYKCSKSYTVSILYFDLI